MLGDLERKASKSARGSCHGPSLPTASRNLGVVSVSAADAAAGRVLMPAAMTRARRSACGAGAGLCILIVD